MSISFFLYNFCGYSHTLEYCLTFSTVYKNEALKHYLLIIKQSRILLIFHGEKICLNFVYWMHKKLQILYIGHKKKKITNFVSERREEKKPTHFVNAIAEKCCNFY